MHARPMKRFPSIVGLALSIALMRSSERDLRETRATTDGYRFDPNVVADPNVVVTHMAHRPIGKKRTRESGLENGK